MTTAPDNRCLTCGGSLGEVFFRSPPVPVHTCLLLTSATAAMDFPRSRVQLAACKDCGTITNVAFDRRWSAYSPDYEDQQIFSPTFGSFSWRLATDLVSRHGLGGKQVVDVGSSKGDFLHHLCEAGAGEGIGIDPSSIPGRVPAPARGEIRLIQALYGREHLGLPAALITCRHTLEHVFDVRDTLELMREHAQRAGGVPVLIEVPDMRRVLSGATFEDIFYEHCSYFTPGALARALRAAGFGVARLWLDYDDQYLFAEANPDPAHDRRFALEEPVEETLRLVETFSFTLPGLIGDWTGRLDRIAPEGRSLAIWGSGSKCVAVIYALDLHGRIDAITDVNPHRWGRYVPGIDRPIVSPDDLARVRPDVVWIMNRIYRAEIQRALDELGLSPELLVLGEAPAETFAPGAR